MSTDGINEVVVSTIVEHLFQYFDEDLIAKDRRYQRLERAIKLRSALFIFDEFGIAHFSEADKSLPMFVPTKWSMEIIGTGHLTTPVKPLHLPVRIYIPHSEARKHDEYEVGFRRSFDDLLVDYLARIRGWLYLSELGWAEHRRTGNGRLCWTLTKLGIENKENGTFEKLALSGDRYGKN